MSDHDYNLDILRNDISIFAALGFAISNFSQIDFGLLCIFDATSGWSQKKSNDIFWKIGSTRAQLRIIDKLISSDAREDDAISNWTIIKSNINECIKLRDGLAHGEAVSLHRAPGIKDVFFAPRFQKNLDNGTGSDPLVWQPAERLSEEELLEIAQNFWHVGASAAAFSRSL